MRIDGDPWTITAMNAVEITLRSHIDSSKEKIKFGDLRSGRYSFRPA